jgi:hypothetical protein
MADIQKTLQNLRKRGFIANYFETGKKRSNT